MTGRYEAARQAVDEALRLELRAAAALAGALAGVDLPDPARAALARYDEARGLTHRAVLDQADAALAWGEPGEGDGGRRQNGPAPESARGGLVVRNDEEWQGMNDLRCPEHDEGERLAEPAGGAS